MQVIALTKQLRGVIGQRLLTGICSSSCELKRQKAGANLSAALQFISYKAVLRREEYPKQQ